MHRPGGLGSPARVPLEALYEAGCVFARAVASSAAHGQGNDGAPVRRAGSHLLRGKEGCDCGSIAVEVLANPISSVVRGVDGAEATVTCPSLRQIGCHDQTRPAAA